MNDYSIPVSPSISVSDSSAWPPKAMAVAPVMKQVGHKFSVNFCRTYPRRNNSERNTSVNDFCLIITWDAKC